jgi:HAD superfamily hydrolase (TIGR01490 family)
MTLAIFDLDNTLIAGDSDHLWGDFLCDKGVVDERSFRAANERFYADYRRGELDIAAYLRFALTPLRGKTPAELRPLQEEFMATRIARILLPQAEALLESHRRQGHRLLIVTATNEFVTAPIARRLGVDTLLGCSVEIRDGVYTGAATGTLTYREGKVARLAEWMTTEQESLDGAWFYSDSQNDLALLERVANPVAVDADEILAAVARKRGWPQISLRDGPAD